MKKLLLLALLLAPSAHAATAIPIRVVSSPINVSLIARAPATCYAPCLVTFDTTGLTDSSVTSQPYHEIQRVWSFGDTNVTAIAAACGNSVASGEGFWRCGSNPGANSKNAATGPVAAHVFESAGTYTVTATIYDGTTTVAPTVSKTVTAWPADGTTICVANGSTPVAGSGGCPAGASVANQSDWATILGYLKSGTTCSGGTVICNRVLLKTGDTFTSSAGGSWAVSGTTTKAIGAYGSAAKPIVQASGGGYFFVYTAAAATSGDLVVSDISFDCNSQSGTGVANFSQPFTRWLGLRLQASNCTADVFSTTQSAANVYMNQLALVDTVIGPISAGQYLIWGGSTNSFYAGNSLTGPTQSGGHNARNPFLNKGVVSNNTSSLGLGDAWKIHGPNFNTTGQTSQWIVVSDNKLVASQSAITLWVAPQFSTSADHIEDVIIERNFLPAAIGSAVDGQMRINAKRVSIRNNLIDATNATGVTGIRFVVDSSSPAPDSIWVYHNTMYSNKAAGFTAFNVASGAAPTSGITFKNNLAYGPQATGTPSLVADAGAGVITSSFNTCGTGSVTSCSGAIKTGDPLFTTSPPVVVGDFKPTCTGSTYPCAQGTAVPVWSDFFLAAEPATRDIGAVVH